MKLLAPFILLLIAIFLVPAWCPFVPVFNGTLSDE